MEQYLSEIISAVLGFLGGIGMTICYQKNVFSVKQKNIKSGGGDVAGRDINK